MRNKKSSLVFFHAKPDFVLRGYDFDVHAVLTDGAVKDGADLIWSAGETCGRVKMAESRADASCGGEYTLLTAVIPASALTANEVRYSFSCNSDKIKSEEFTAQIADAGKLPPIMVTEFYGRPKGLGVTVYIEVMNPTDKPADLYDYKLMMFIGGDKKMKPIGSVMLADEPGKTVIAPGALALLWPQYPKHHMLEGGKYSTPEGFCEVMNAEFPKPLFQVKPEELNLIKVEFSRYDEATAAYVFKEGLTELPSKDEKVTLLIVPREGEAGDAVYSMEYNCDAGCNRDTPVRHSSLWGIDVRNPRRGEAQKHISLATPGKLSEGQACPDLCTGYPTVFPVSAGKELSAAGGLVIAFDVLSGKVCGAAVSLKSEDGSIITRDAEKAGNGRYTVKFPEEVTDWLLKLEYFITLYDGVRKSVLGSVGFPLATLITDDKGPAILSIMPTEKYAYDNSRKPEISVEFFDVSGIDTKESVLTVDGKNVTAMADWQSGSMRYTPGKPMRYGAHEFDITLLDKRGNKTYRHVGFAICRPDELNFYRGEVHAHTADSDGIAGPGDALAYARDVGKVDFFSVTEHSHYMLPEVYAEQVRKADQYDDPGRFAALFGWEMTWNGKCGLWGHMNILNAKWLVTDIKGNGIPEIYERLKNDRGAVAMFNHPGLGWGNFLDYSDYSPDADRAVCLSEIKGAGYDREYSNMLSRGWHVTPAFNEDNHDFNWTTATKSTTYALAPALTRANILDAFRRRRTYSTSDPTMKIYYKINGEWMGSRLASPKKLAVDLKITTENERGIGSVALVAEDNIIVASINAGALREYHWKLNLPPIYDYYYVRVTSQGQYTVTAPIWIEGPQPLMIEEFKYNRGEDDYKPNVMTAKITNSGQSTIKELKADFYLTPAAGFELSNTVPYATVNIADLTAGGSAFVGCSYPDLAGLRRASVVVSGKNGQTPCGDTAAALLTPIRIGKICADTSPATGSDGVEIKNPFSYIQIINLSNRAVKLDGCFTRLWDKTGKAPVEDKMLKLDGLTIAAGKTLTVWKKPKGSTLTADDFNKRHGVMLREGEELIASEIPFVSTSAESRRLELLCGTETLSRVEYNFGKHYGKDVVTDHVMVFDYQPNITGTSVLAGNDAGTGYAASL